MLQNVIDPIVASWIFFIVPKVNMSLSPTMDSAGLPDFLKFYFSFECLISSCKISVLSEVAETFLQF